DQVSNACQIRTSDFNHSVVEGNPFILAEGAESTEGINVTPALQKLRCDVTRGRKTSASHRQGVCNLKTTRHVRSFLPDGGLKQRDFDTSLGTAGGVVDSFQSLGDCNASGKLAETASTTRFEQVTDCDGSGTSDYEAQRFTPRMKVFGL